MVEPKSESPTLSANGASSKKRKRPDFGGLSYATITLTASDGKQFSIHQSLAYHHSPVLREYFVRKQAKGKVQKLAMELDDTAEVLSALVRWMYSGSLHGADNRELPSLGILFDLWFLANSLAMPELQNQTITSINEKRVTEAVIPTNHAVKVYENSLPDSPIRKFLVDYVVRSLSAESFRKDITDNPNRYPLEFVVDIAISSKRLHKIMSAAGARMADMSPYMVEVPIEEDETTRCAYEYGDSRREYSLHQHESGISAKVIEGSHPVTERGNSGG